jgi:polyribonucleotide nucleotidyltransferase
MDMKVQGISFETLGKALGQAREGRDFILEKMAETIEVPRDQVSEHAPQFINMEIDAEDIGSVIGPGGNVIQTLQKETNTEIWVEEDEDQRVGLVTISGNDLDNVKEAKKRIERIVGHLEEGATYDGEVKAIKNYGAFVEVAPGKDGLLHISEISNEHVNDVHDELSVGDHIVVKLLQIQRGGKLRLSMKALLAEDTEE